MIPINTTQRTSPDLRVLDALGSDSSSTRLQAALAAGTHPDVRFVGPLVARCAIEPDFYVRDMLTWALTRLPAADTVPVLLAELGSEVAQARSQALHTLSKIGDRAAWPAITRSLLHDADDEVARSAWRAAVVLVPDGERPRLARDLADQFGRGDRTVRLSLSRALVALGTVIEPVLRAGSASADLEVRAHAHATERLLRDPDAGFDESKRIVALGPEGA
ncbi:HEAT repeat domain-containing protein [Amycolatopsis sp. EV170708-02-1]|uniref:HEAT repeat domain-containing protein n=1 Tax=Amycolatopsis sp. EV170708-02-1 TaxID=2919322 RepID=UPI001F0C6A3F|nr:HEAT repeat domain-containing protein [Amycolatopsis sp. EV170708-02-1]UMP03653.1 HEAT repeat domain-containing protein [Amycolatopsis sp. EV170708-02-1]